MIHPLIETDASLPATSVLRARPSTLEATLSGLPAAAAAFARAQGFKAKEGAVCLLPGEDGAIAAALFGVAEEDAARDPLHAGALPARLPEGLYALEGADETDVLAWLMGAYSFDRYRKPARPAARLIAPAGVDVAAISRIAEAVALGRDLVNTPANDMGPAEIEEAARALAARFGAQITVTTGEALLAAGFPMIHAVGRASTRAPRLIDIRWGRKDAPKATLVGKGVAFDTGGLNIKPDASMALMKKDMGGAACALAAAAMVMGSGLDLRLRVLIPAVENAISGDAFRPGDVLKSRKGLMVEIGNTDAEGRLILADALALADEEAPEIIADFATLTGAARVALGPDLPPFMTDDEALASDIARLSAKIADPVWRLPLWGPYAQMLKSEVADINHISGGSFAGAITAALFLRRFVAKAGAHVHFDVYGWTPNAKPGRPKGGEVQAARLVHALLAERYPARGSAAA
ncbi:MAG: leucyl aminopeptidase family protein [Salinarimonadaceae bacterium]|nr:MAG: leucyl aminopeptidase family protein [Salinarimonadaceae bacterium]